jgi:hypothetical protein
MLRPAWSRSREAWTTVVEGLGNAPGIKKLRPPWSRPREAWTAAVEGLGNAPGIKKLRPTWSRPREGWAMAVEGQSMSGHKKPFSLLVMKRVCDFESFDFQQ